MLSLDCEMSAVHGLLSKIPDTLSYKQVMVMAHQLFEKHSPKKLAKSKGLKLSARPRCCIESYIHLIYSHTSINTKWTSSKFISITTQFLPMKVSFRATSDDTLLPRQVLSFCVPTFAQCYILCARLNL